VEAMVTDTDVANLYRRLMASPAMLRSLCPPDQELPAEIEAICRYAADSLDDGKLRYEDVAPIILLEKVLSGREAKRPINQLLIDEIQDYTPIQLEYLKKQFPGVNITALGDSNQVINPFTTEPLEAIFWRIFTGDSKKHIQLNKSYRSTQEIALFSRSIIGDHTSDIEDVRRGGEKPRFIRVDDTKDLLAVYDELLEQLPATDAPSLAIICKSAHRTQEVHRALAPKHPDLFIIKSDMAQFLTGQVVIPVYLAKGLEFDIVVIDDAGEENYDMPWYKTILYTACTRAMQQLIVTYTGKLSPILRAVDPGLYQELLPRKGSCNNAV
jgi:DNA helicase-2/ATP-dependent DNA helicase PcrA